MRSLIKRGVTCLSLAACLSFAHGLLADEQWQDDWDDDWDSYVHEDDPWEKWNRKVFSFNHTMDTYALRPVASGYRKITNEPVRRSVRNVFNNLGEPKNLANNLLQAKFKDAGVDVSRFLLNTTFGVLGVFDVASKMGLQRNDEDFGQTLGKWGVPSGPYVMLPVLGPSTLRDAPALIPDTYTTVYPYMDNRLHRYSLALFEGVTVREGLLDGERLITGDRYNFIRNAYLQNREYRVKDGMVEDDF